jgi:hypothetical protein
MHSDHRCGHIIAGGISVEAAIDRATLIQQWLEPKRIGPSPGGGKTPTVGMESKATDSVDSRFTENDRAGGADGDRRWLGGHSEEAQILLGTGRQAVPRAGGGAAQFSAHGQVFLSKEQENGIAPGVAIHDTGLDKRIENHRIDSTLVDQILFDAFQFAGIGRGNAPRWPGRGRNWRRQGHIGKMLRQPIDRRFEVQVLEMDDQVNGTATAGVAVPVHELGAGH